MKIVICGSMSFAKEILDMQQKLNRKNHSVFIPENAEGFSTGDFVKEKSEIKMELDVFSKYFEEIKNADAVLILNYNKNGIENYIGGNALIEMAFAKVLKKKIFLLYDIPNGLSYNDEIVAMKPILLKGDISKFV